MLDEKAARAAADAVTALREAFAARLLCVAVYGSGAGDDFVPSSSDVNLLVVLDAVTVADLQQIRPHLKGWAKGRIATPLVIDRSFLRNAADVFPIEILNIKEQHRILYGEDLLSALTVRAGDLRHQCEFEVRGKKLRLHELYLESGGTAGRLRALMLDSLKSFLLITRNLCRLQGAASLPANAEALQTLAAQAGVGFPQMTRLLDVRHGRAQWPADLHSMFASYLDEVQHLVRLVDGLATTTPPDAPL